MLNQFDDTCSHVPSYSHRHCFQLKRLIKQQNGHEKSRKSGNKVITIPTLVSSYSVHDYHTYGIHGTGHTNGLHFHLAATINAQTGLVELMNDLPYFLILTNINIIHTNCNRYTISPKPRRIGKRKGFCRSLVEQ